MLKLLQNKFLSNIRTACRMALLFLLTVLASTAVSAERLTASGKVWIESTSIAAGIGMSWGNGKLNLDGKEYRFSIDGITFVDFGVSKSSAAGEVYSLTNVAQFEGNYVAAEADFAFGGGIGGVWLRNQNGVLMRLHSVSQGVRLQLGTSGMTIKFWNH